MTYEEIVAKVRDLFSGADVSGVGEHLAYQFNIVGEGEGAFYIAFKDNALDVAPYEYYDRDAILIASAEDFIKIADGSLNAVAAFTTGRLKVEGSIDKALELQKMIEVMGKNGKKTDKAAKKPAKKTAKK